MLRDLHDRADSRRSTATIEEMLHHPALIVPLDATERHVGAATGLYERVMREHGFSLETIAEHRQKTVENLHAFRFHDTDDDQHYERRTAFYQAYFRDHAHAQGRA